MIHKLLFLFLPFFSLAVFLILGHFTFFFLSVLCRHLQDITGCDLFIQLQEHAFW